MELWDYLKSPECKQDDYIIHNSYGDPLLELLHMKQQKKEVKLKL